MDVNIPQLRVRTEFTFGKTFAPVGLVAARLAELNTPSAGIVDTGTWGHVKAARAFEENGVQPMFGREVPIMLNGMKCIAWVLARDIKGFYEFSSHLEAKPDHAIDLLYNYREALVRFAGGAAGIHQNEIFDFVDLNPGSGAAARHAIAAMRAGKPLVLTSDAFYPSLGYRDAFGAIANEERVTAQTILSMPEMCLQFFPHLTEEEFKQAVANTIAAADMACSVKLPKAPIIHVDGNLRGRVAECQIDKLASGRLKSWPDHYQARIERELAVIEEKGFESYFIVVADLIDWAKERMLVGPGRGSSAGSLVCYLLGITEIDPIEHGLLFERFIDINRADLPDIDIDFNDKKRDMVFDYLSERYGRENVARLGNVNTLQPKSVMARVCDKFCVPDRDRFDLLGSLIVYEGGDARAGHSLEDTLSSTDVGRAFADKHPAATVLALLENHASHTGVHAAGVIVCQEPVTHFCTVGADGIAQIDKPDAETLNLLKIDALGLRTLGIIEDAGVVKSEQLFALTYDDQQVFDVINNRRFSGVFQFEGGAQRGLSEKIYFDDFRAMDHATALARPGPLGSGAAHKYIERKAGREPVQYIHASLEPILQDTFGVILYQEQVMRICHEIGGFDWPTVSKVRKAVSSSKGREAFDKHWPEFEIGAARTGMLPRQALELWEEMRTFGAYGMNRAHTCAYAAISYWCAWMKRYHGLAYAAAALRNAKDDEQTVAMLREMHAEGVQYLAFDPKLSGDNWSVQDGKLVGGFRNLVGFGPAKSAQAIEERNTHGELQPKTMARVEKAKVKFADLYPLQSAYAPIFADPEAHGCREGSVVNFIDALPEEGSVLLIGTIKEKRTGDFNDSARVAKRGGKLSRGQTKFIDLMITDDTGGPLMTRIERDEFIKLGRRASELVAGDVVMVRGARVKDFNLVKILGLRCLTRPEIFE